jgi:hypothetical protein
VLAGSFGELRPNHFHTGIDIKTNGREGMPVHAAADGYISHISISGYGYGNMLMVSHPNGFTTLYGHLQQFSPELQQYIRDIQYKTKKFAQEVDLPKGKFPVKKGQKIALSGNTGGSRAPHLHFEIRKTKSQQPVNPMLFGFNIPDSVPPVIYAIKIYPMDSESAVKVYYRGRKTAMVAGYDQNVKLYAQKHGGQYILSNVERIEGTGRLGFSIDGNDYMNNTYNTMGLYSIELCVEESRIYFHNMNELDFDLKRFINAHTDYAERMHTGRWFEKSYILPGDILPIYKGIKENGMVGLEKGKNYQMSYYVSDKQGNQAILGFSISCPAEGMAKPKVETVSYEALIPYNKPYTLRKEGMTAWFPANAFYRDIPLAYTHETANRRGVYSDYYEIGTRYFAVNQPYKLSIQTRELPVGTEKKAFIYSSARGYQGGTYKDGWITADVLTLGKFYIVTDTLPPRITSVNIRQGKNMHSEKAIIFRMSDNLAGINTFDGYVDGNWVLFEYDPRVRMIYYQFDQHVEPGKHILLMRITDRVGNIMEQKYAFSR